MGLPELSLNHLNLPARDPVALGRWYVEKLGFRANGPFLWSGASLLVFEKGEPSQGLHFGFRIASLVALNGWVETLRARGVVVDDVTGDENYSTVYVRDPEGNMFELFYEKPL